MKFVMQRNLVVSSVLGHAIGFEKGVPTHVPPSMYEEVMSRGAVPEEDMPESEVKKSDALTPEDRKILLSAAIEELVTKNDSKDFTAAGMPHVKVLSAKVGFNVEADERDAAFAAFTAARK